MALVKKKSPVKRKPPVKAYVAKSIKIKQELGYWEYNGPNVDVSDYFGFIYMMINKTNGMQYIGKRQFYTYKKGSMKRTGVNPWRNYSSSSSHVKDALANGDKFSYVILGVFDSRAWLSYTEAHLQMVFNTLVERDSDGERLWYNNQIAPIKYIPKKDNKAYSELMKCVDTAHTVRNLYVKS